MHILPTEKTPTVTNNSDNFEIYPKRWWQKSYTEAAKIMESVFIYIHSFINWDVRANLLYVQFRPSIYSHV